METEPTIPVAVADDDQRHQKVTNLALYFLGVLCVKPQDIAKHESGMFWDNKAEKVLFCLIMIRLGRWSNEKLDKYLEVIVDPKKRSRLQVGFSLEIDFLEKTQNEVVFNLPSNCNNNDNRGGDVNQVR